MRSFRALLFASDAEIPSLLKGLVMMCGVFTNTPQGSVGQREWNALNDPHATAMVYHASVSSHRSVGLDVTMQVSMEMLQFRERCTAPLLRPVLDFAEVWFEQREKVVFHDPLAATTIFDATICEFRRGTVKVEIVSERLAGLTCWEPGGSQRGHEVALAVKPERFFEHYFGATGS